MSTLPLLLLMVMLSSCALFSGQKVKSEWSVFKEVKHLDCGTWPMNPRDLSPNFIQVLKGPKAGLVADVTRRNGSTLTYYAPFKDDETIPLEDLEAREFGVDSFVAGGGNISNRVSAVVVLKKNNNSRLEVRSMQDNVVRFSSDNTLPVIRAGKSAFTKSGFWLIYKAGPKAIASNNNEDASLSEINYKILFAGMTAKDSKLKLRQYDKVEFPADAELLVGEDQKKAFVVWKKTANVGSRKVFQLFIRELSEDAALVAQSTVVNIPLVSDVESWDVGRMGDRILVAIVDGDSLVGQANLKAAMVQFSEGIANLMWVKDEPITNEHVSLPIWYVKGTSAHLLIPKWVDEESTIAAYKVGVSGFEDKKPALGVFPKGSRVMDVFSDATSKDAYALVRFRGKFGWRFDVCNLERL
jgi:hypothetical protein